MNILGIGTDIVEIKRVKKIYNKYGDNFAKKILSNDEFKKYKFSNKKISFLAKRFAAKEAIGKAIGIGIRNGVILRYLSINNDGLGRPFVKIENHKKFNLTEKEEIHISLSDERKYAIANALIISK